MAAPLCAYELQREANVARNQAVLAALGLGGDNSLKGPKPPPKKPPPKPADEDTDASPKFVRRSGRSTNAPPSYAEGLSDAFMCAEEKSLERRERQSNRPQRKRLAPSYHSDEQANAIMAREEANAAKRRARQAELERQARARQQQAYMQQQSALVMRAPSAPVLPSMSSMPTFTTVAPVAAKKQWRVDQPVVKCVRCGGLYAQRKDGKVRDHYCSPIVSVAAPVVAHLPAM